MARLFSDYLITVMSLEVASKTSETKPIATGFLFGRKSGEKDQSEKELYNIFLVTNRHVFEDHETGKLLKKISLRFNMQTNQHA